MTVATFQSEILMASQHVLNREHYFKYLITVSDVPYQALFIFNHRNAIRNSFIGYKEVRNEITRVPLYTKSQDAQYIQTCELVIFMVALLPTVSVCTNVLPLICRMKVWGYQT